METLETALCLHAQDFDLNFLNSVRTGLSKLLKGQAISCEMSTQRSHVDAMIALQQLKTGLVIIFAHGTTDYILGGEYWDRLTGERLDYGKFLKSDNLTVLHGKVVFCMSCDSNGLAEASLNAGAIAFVGFDKIPFNRFNADKEPIGSNTLVKHCQEILIAPAITATLERFLTGRATLDEAVDYLRLWITKSAIAYVREYKSVKERREVAALFLKVKDGLRYHGPLGIRFAINAG